jgi:hypothetical protein
MTDPRPNNEPRPRVEPQEPPTRALPAVSAAVMLAIGVAWLVLFAVHLAHSEWPSFWWELVSGLVFLVLGISRARGAAASAGRARPALAAAARARARRCSRQSARSNRR